jgi:hypothetical protein
VIQRSAFLLLLLLLTVRGVSGEPIDLSSRVVVAAMHGEEARCPAVVLYRRSEGAEIRFHVDEGVDIEETSYAVHVVPIGEVTTGPVMLANGTRTNIDAFRRGDGYLYRLHPWHLQRGENILTLVGEEGEELLVADLTVFSLRDTFEEIHFERAFVRREDVMTSVQPPTHPNQDRYDALHYNLAITLNMANTFIDAELTMDGRATDAGLQQIVLDFHPNNGSLVVSQVDRGPGTSTLPFSVSNADRRLFITLPQALTLDEEFTVRVRYSGTPATAGAFGAPYRRSTHGANIPIIFTFSEPYGARQWWPCKDVPHDKATIDLQVTAAMPYTVVSNGELLSTETLPGSLRRFNYTHSYPVSTYLVSICATNYLYAERTYTALDGTTTMPVGAYVFPSFPEDLAGVDGTLEIMNFFRDRFGEYPFVEEKYVTAAHTINTGMEPQTTSSMAPPALIDGGTGRQQVHELAHMWFGDLVTMEYFDHLWLNEGWATYAEAMWQEHKFGRQAYLTYVTNWDTVSGISDSLPLVNPNADAFSGSLVYRKGGFVLHMLRRVVGDEAFYEAANLYLQTHPYGNTVTEDLQAAYEEVWGAPLDWFFEQWCYRAGRPSYAWSWWMTGAPGNRVLNVNILQAQGGAAYRMPIEIHAVNGGVRQVHVVENTDKVQTFAIPVGSFEPTAVEFDPENYVLKTVTTVPLTIEGVFVQSDGIRISWIGGQFASDAIEVLHSTDLVDWTTLEGDELTAAPGGGVVHAAAFGMDHYYRVISRNVSTNAIRETTNAHGARRGTGDPRVLVVEGYERWVSQNRGPWHPWAAWTGRAIGANGHSWESVSNKVIGATVQLGDYDAVIYVLGEESTVHETFSTAEQELVKTYLRNGGQLFVTGAEIGWDLDNRGSTADRAFYREFLKAQYNVDDSTVYNVLGQAGLVFDGLSFAFDNGTAGIYFQDWPDAITPINGGVTSLRYDHATRIAGVQYEGLFPAGTESGKLVHLGFAFETIYPEATRAHVMGRVLDFFGIVAPTVEGEYLAIE